MRSRTVGLGLLCTALVALGAMSSSAGPALSEATACSVSSADQAVDAEEQGLLNLINQYRAANGKNALTMHPTVTKAAAWFSRDMAGLNYFPGNHVDSNGRDPAGRLTWCGVTYSNYAENIYAGRSDAQSVFDAWRNSPTHNANMLRDGVTAAGIARAYNAASTYGWYWTLDVTNSAAVATTTTTVAPTTTTTVAPTTTTTLAPATTTTVAPTPTTSTAPATTVATTTTLAPTTTAPSTTVPPAGSPEWWAWYTAQRQAAGG